MWVKVHVHSHEHAPFAWFRAASHEVARALLLVPMIERFFQHFAFKKSLCSVGIACYSVLSVFVTFSHQSVAFIMNIDEMSTEELRQEAAQLQLKMTAQDRTSLIDAIISHFERFRSALQEPTNRFSNHWRGDSALRNRAIGPWFPQLCR